jgi:phospholipase C
MFKYVALLLALAIATNAASLGDVKHVIMLMMENRSFQHVSVYCPSNYTCLHQQSSIF